MQTRIHNSKSVHRVRRGREITIMGRRGSSDGDVRREGFKDEAGHEDDKRAMCESVIPAGEFAQQFMFFSKLDGHVVVQIVDGLLWGVGKFNTMSKHFRNGKLALHH